MGRNIKAALLSQGERDARNLRILDAWNAGETLEGIGTRESLTREGVRRVLGQARERGQAVRATGADPRGDAFRHLLDAGIIALWNAGRDTGGIVAALGCAESEVRSALMEARERGVEVRLGHALPLPVRDLILDLWNAGKTAKEIAAVIGGKERAVHNVVARQRGKGAVTRPLSLPSERGRRPSPNHGRVLALWAEGKTSGEIGRMLGMTTGQVTSMVATARRADPSIRRVRPDRPPRGPNRPTISQGEVVERLARGESAKDSAVALSCSVDWIYRLRRAAGNAKKA